MIDLNGAGGIVGRTILVSLVAMGAAAMAVGLVIVPERTLANVLIDNFYVLSLSLMGLVFLAIQYVGGAGWFSVFRRVPESMSAFLPAGAVLMLVVLVGIPNLYHWADEDAVAADPILAAKSAWLDVPGFAIRMIAFLLVWYLFGRRFRDLGGRPGEPPADTVRRRTRTGAVFLILFAITFSLAAIDWIMSLEPHWFSTLFPWYVFSSMFVAGLALMTVLVLVLRKAGRLREVGEAHIHDLGKYVFAFSFFWGYLWYSQYMLIWYANIPEETTWYLTRHAPEWNGLFLANPVVNFVIPFLVLLPATVKKRECILFAVCLLVLAGHWLDLYLMVVPSRPGALPTFGLLELAMALGLGSLFGLYFDRALERADRTPLDDPFLVEGLGHGH